MAWSYPINVKGLSLRGLPSLKAQSRPALLALFSLGLHGLFLSIPLSSQLFTQSLLEVGLAGQISSLDFSPGQLPIGSLSSDSGTFITDSSGSSSNKASLKPTLMMVEPARPRVRLALAEAISSQATASQPPSKVPPAKAMRPRTIIVRPQRVVQRQTVVIRTVTQPPVFISVNRSQATHSAPISLASDRNFGSDLGLELTSSETSTREMGTANASTTESGNVLSLVPDQTPTELFKGFFWPNLQGKGYEISASPIGEYAGGPVYQVKRGTLLGYLNLVPMGEGKGTLVVMWGRSPLTGKTIPTNVRLKKPEQKEAGTPLITPKDVKSDVGAN